MNDEEQQHPDRFAPTPLARGESQTLVSLENSPSPVKGWQPEADGVDATGKKDDYHNNQHIILKKFTANLPRNHRLKSKAKALRKAGILSEVLFWQQVHRKKFYGLNSSHKCNVADPIKVVTYELNAYIIRTCSELP
ncbi:MAG: hypothetical protein Q9N02_04925 [Ghiorsea sp.]|nr:hypothetical protein [Ghiorsea sp.]